MIAILSCIFVSPDELVRVGLVLAVEPSDGKFHTTFHNYFIHCFVVTLAGLRQIPPSILMSYKLNYCL